ncbi:MAG: tetratricopeptide repeat protein [Ignavibacteriales bacterium]|nr:tetratricopeptide repeat protein [Ignavibacteriales bacterium]
MSLNKGDVEGRAKSLTRSFLFSALFLLLFKFASGQPGASAVVTVAEEQDYTFANGLYKDGVYQLASLEFEKFLSRYPQSLRRVDAAFLKSECAFQLQKFDVAVRGFTTFVKEYPRSPLTDDAYFRIGESHLKRNKTDDAVTAFKTVLDRFQQGDLAGEAAYWIGESYNADGDYDNAMKYYSLAFENYPNNRLRDYALYSIGQLYQQKPNYAKAIESYSKLIKDLPDSKLAPSAKVRIGECYYYTKAYRRAIDELTKLRITIQQTEERGEADYLIAEAHYQLGEYFVAQNKYDLFLSSYPDHKLEREVIYALGWTYLKLKEYQKAAHTFDRLTSGNDALAHAGLFRRGVAEKFSGDTQASLRTFAEVAQRKPQGEFADNALYEAGILLYDTRTPADAKHYFQRITSEYPSSDVLADATRMLGECLAAETNYKEAMEAFSKAASSHEASFDIKVVSSYQVGWCQLKLKMYREASATFRAFVTAYPQHPKAGLAQFWLAESQYQLGNYESALQAYQTVAATAGSEKHEDALYGIGWSYFKLGRFEKASESFEKLVMSYPNGKLLFDTRLRLADSYFFDKDYKKAVAAYRTVIRAYPTKEETDYAHYQLGQSLVRQGDNAQGYQQFSSLIKTYPKSGLADDAQYALGWINFQKKVYLEAIKEFQKLIAQYPNSELLPRAYYSLGDCYYNLQQYVAAEKSYREVIQQFPQSHYVLDAVTGIQYCLVAQNKPEQALAVIDAYAKESSTGGIAEDLYLKKGEMLYTQGKYNEALREYKSFTEKYPKSPNVGTAFYWLAKCLEAQRDLSGAALTFERAANAPQGSKKIAAQALLEAATIYSRQQKFDRAFDALGRIEKEFKEQEVLPEAQFAKAVLFVQNNNDEDARRHFETLIERYPSTQAADKGRVALAGLYLKAGVSDHSRKIADQVATSRADEIGAEAQYLVGMAWTAMNKWEEASTAFLRVKYVFPAYEQWLAKAYLGLGTAYEGMQDVGKAKEAYQNVLKFKKEEESIAEAQRRLKKLERS